MDNLYIKEKLIKSYRSIESIFSDDVLIFTIDLAAKEMAATFKNGGKLMICGTGLSATVAQNMAGSLSGKISRDRPPLFAEALHLNPTFITGVSSEYGFDEAYARMVLSMGNPGDMLIGICGTGTSTSVINAMAMSSQLGIKTIGIIGKSDSKMKEFCGEAIEAGSDDIQRTQECHLLIGNIMCEIAESIVYKKN
jgi:D-sedoheptulose 7-phosphate isomerase